MSTGSIAPLTIRLRWRLQRLAASSRLAQVPDHLRDDVGLPRLLFADWH